MTDLEAAILNPYGLGKLFTIAQLRFFAQYRLPITLQPKPRRSTRYGTPARIHGLLSGLSWGIALGRSSDRRRTLELSFIAQTPMPPK
jgi:hypothetical protein